MAILEELMPFEYRNDRECLEWNISHLKRRPIEDFQSSEARNTSSLECNFLIFFHSTVLLLKKSKEKMFFFFSFQSQDFRLLMSGFQIYNRVHHTRVE